VWIDPATNGEFDVAIGARVKSVDGDNICLIDDDNQVTIVICSHYVIIMSPLRRHIFVCFMAKSAFWVFFRP